MSPSSEKSAGLRPVLIVGTIDRPDLLTMFKSLVGNVPMTFLEYRFNYRRELHPENYVPYGPVVSWDQFANADDLLDRIMPRRVVLLFNTSLNQVALKLAAQRRGIPTFHLQHGFRLRFDEHLQFEEEIRPKAQHRAKAFVSRSPREVACALREHAFFWRSLPAMDARTRRRAAGFALQNYRGKASPRLSRAYADIRRLDEYIAHAPEDFNQHWGEDALDQTNFRGVHFIGFPQFDDLCDLGPVEVDDRNVILIDHQFHNSDFFGWNLDFRRSWTASIADIVRRLGLRLHIKQHPGDTSDSWRTHLSPGSIELIDFEGLRRRIPATRSIMGTASSMQMPLAGMEHTVLIALEIHPRPGPMLSKGFVRTGVGHAVTTYEELEQALRKSLELLNQQSPHKAPFIEQFLHRVDGQAGNRLRRILGGEAGVSPIVSPAAVGETMRKLK
jgi:hypothetical protein